MNYNNDSIYIHPLAQVGTSWSFFHPSGSTNIIANVTGIDPILINGLLDSIKTIHLSNGSDIILSKNHGFYKLIPFLDFPAVSYSYILSDQPLLTYGNVYDFDIGDTLQYGSYSCSGPGGCYTRTWNITTNVVTGKYFSPLQDSVFYNFWIQSVHNFIAQDSLGHYYLVSSITDTDSTLFYTNLNTPLFNFMPEETDTSYSSLFEVLYYTPGSANRYHILFEDCNRISYYTRSGDIVYYDQTNCFPIPDEPTVESNGFSIGLGQIISNHHECCGGTSYIHELVAYHKANSNCGSIVIYNSVDELNGSNSKVKIYPNPISSEGYFFIEKVDNDKSLFELIDISGKNIFSKQLTDQLSMIDANEFPSGFYFYRITSRDGSIITGKIVK